MNLFESPKQEGINRAINNADAKVSGWSDKCYSLLLDYLQTLRPDEAFRCEMFRHWCADKLEKPPHDRAFGGVIQKASKAGIIQFVAHAKVTNVKAHQAYCSVWKKAA